LGRDDLDRLTNVAKIERTALERVNKFLGDVAGQEKGEGSRLCVLIQDSKGVWHAKETIFTLPAVELWSLSSTQEDINIRAEMISMLGFKGAVNFLSRYAYSSLAEEFGALNKLLVRSLSREEYLRAEGRQNAIFCNLLMRCRPDEFRDILSGKKPFSIMKILPPTPDLLESIRKSVY
jgi:hypothetical protein